MWGVLVISFDPKWATFYAESKNKESLSPYRAFSELYRFTQGLYLTQFTVSLVKIKPNG